MRFVGTSSFFIDKMGDKIIDIIIYVAGTVLAVLGISLAFL